MQKSYDVPKLGRLQISLSNGYDPKIIAAALKMAPLKVEVVGYTEQGIRLLVTHPIGIKVNILENIESHQSFYANTDSDAYQLLFVPRKPGTGVVLTGDEKSIQDDLLKSRKYPIVVEPVSTSSRAQERLQILIACFDSIKIERLERMGVYTAHDPFGIPKALQDLMSICDEKIPKDASEIDVLSKRIKNIRELFQWYDKRILADETRETLVICLAKLNDFQIRVDGLLMKRPSNKYENVLLSGSNINYLDDFLAQYKDEAGFTEIENAIKDEDWMLPPIHNCQCGAQARLETSTIQSGGGSKEVFYVRCPTCKNKSKRHDWGLASQTIASWNKQNGSYSIDLYPVSFGLDGLNENKIHSKIKQINTLVMKLVPAINELPISAKESLSFVVERATEIQVWSSYIRMSLKEKRANRSNQ